MCVMGWDWACTQREEREKENIKHTNPHTDAQPPSHRGPGLRSKPLAGRGQLGLRGAECASGQESLLVGDWAWALSKQDPCFPTGWEEIRECQKILTLLYLLP